MRVRVLSRAAVEAGEAQDGDALVSIRPSRPGDFGDLDLAIQQAVLSVDEDVLVLSFDDIGIPAYGPYHGPTLEHIVEILDFARAARERAPDGVLAVHCEFGVSRSSATALAIIADELGPGREEEAVATLMRLDVDGRMQPNPAIVRFADIALFRYGALDAALAAASPRYVQWRAYWQQAAADPAGYYERTLKARSRRRSR